MNILDFDQIHPGKSVGTKPQSLYSWLMEKRGKDNPYQLNTPPGTSSYQMYFDMKDSVEVIVCVVGSTTLYYDARCIQDTVAMLAARGDWMDLGGADEQKEAKPDTLEAWARSENNPLQGWYGLKKGLWGRFGVYVPPLLEELGLVELTHEPKNNRIRIKQ